jgi:hypothetical protein
MEDKLLATLEYLREYRTMAHIGASYGIAESNIQRIIRWVENTLIKDGTFSLPGKKALLDKNCEYEIIQIDVTEPLFALLSETAKCTISSFIKSQKFAAKWIFL